MRTLITLLFVVFANLFAADQIPPRPAGLALPDTSTPPAVLPAPNAIVVRTAPKWSGPEYRYQDIVQLPDGRTVYVTATGTVPAGGVVIGWRWYWPSWQARATWRGTDGPWVLGYTWSQRWTRDELIAPTAAN